MTEYVLDAHTLIWHLEDNPKLGAQSRSILNDPSSVLLLPSIALAEACWAIFKRRTALADWRSVAQAVRADPRVTVVPLDQDIVELAMSLPRSLEMHDAQIIATSMQRQSAGSNVVLLTLDRSITDSALVPVLW